MVNAQTNASRPSVANTMVKLATLADILKAATLLKHHKLINEDPAAVVKRYVQANPDINATLARVNPRTTPR